MNKIAKYSLMTTAVGLLLLAGNAIASPGNLYRFFQDIKLPSQKVIEFQVWSRPAAQNTTGILSHNAGPTDANALVISSFDGQPDYARNLILTPEVGSGATASTVQSCLVNVAGLDINGQSISENFVVSDNTVTAVTGNFAFKSVSSVSFPAGCEASAYGIKWNLGWGVKLGLKACVDHPGDLSWGETGGVFDATRATMATNGSTSVRASTIQFNTSPNGVRDYKAAFVQNYACP